MKSSYIFPYTKKLKPFFFDFHTRKKNSRLANVFLNNVMNGTEVSKKVLQSFT